MKRLNYSQLKPELLATASLNFSAPEDSSARQEMIGSHLSQMLVIDGATLRRCNTGMERRFGSTTFNVKFPCHGEIKATIEKYAHTVGPDSIPLNPQTVIIYESIERGELDMLELPYFHSMHNHFGFRYKLTSSAEKLSVGTPIPKDTILADSPNVDAHGNYMYGTELNACFMSLPGIIEDGVIIAESVIKKLTATGFEKRSGSYGRKRFPLNLYGDENHYKPFPDIGDRVRQDGLLFAFREYDELLGGVTMAEDCLREVDHAFDRRVFAVPGAKAIDITVRRGNQGNNARTPAGMELQAQKYHLRHRQFYDNITHAVETLKRRSQVEISPKLHRLMVEGLIFKNDVNKGQGRQMYNLVELDEWRVDITFEYKMRPNIGSKLTDVHGGKGVVCSIWPDEWMPVDQWGNRAEVVMDGDSTMKRMNPGRFYEQFLNAHGLQMQRTLQALKLAKPKTYVAEGWDMLLRFYGMVSAEMVEVLTNPKQYRGSPQKHVDGVIKNGVYWWLPTDRQITLQHAVQNLRRDLPLEKGPVTYRGLSGEFITTRRDVIVAPVYVILLEKTGENEWSAVSSTKLQPFGIPAKINKHDKYSTPARPMPVRILGESEIRLMVAACGSQPVAELVEMSNSPLLHKHIVTNITRANKPTRIENVVSDPKLLGRGGRNLAFVHHSLEISGVRLERTVSSTREPLVYPPAEGEPRI